MTDQRAGAQQSEPAAGDQADREMEEAAERNAHFSGSYPTDPNIEHGEHCVDSCPYDTPGQAQAREEIRAYVEARENDQAAEYAEAEAGQ